MSLKVPVYEFIPGATTLLTYANSGAVPGLIVCTLRDRNETLISSVTPVSSGGGLYYAPVLHPNSACWVVNEWISVINANTYASRQFGNGLLPQVG